MVSLRHFPDHLIPVFESPEIGPQLARLQSQVQQTNINFSVGKRGQHYTPFLYPSHQPIYWCIRPHHYMSSWVCIFVFQFQSKYRVDWNISTIKKRLHLFLIFIRTSSFNTLTFIVPIIEILIVYIDYYTCKNSVQWSPPFCDTFVLFNH